MSNFLRSTRKQFDYYKQLGEKTFDQVSDEKHFWQPNSESNSISTVVKHLWGNRMRRWTDFMTTYGEKESRQRDAEFEKDLGVVQPWFKNGKKVGLVYSRLSVH